MISYIKGSLEHIGEDTIVIDNNGRGYEIRIPFSVIPELPPIGEEIKIHTYLYVREDAMLLYGFLSGDDLDVFKKLLTVNGIGPKGALGILSTVTPDELRFAIIADDDKTIAKAPGIGKKTAQRLIIDLKDKLKLKDYENSVSNEVNTNNMTEGLHDIRNEAIQALISLGYTNTEAVKVVRNIKDYNTVEDIIKQALKQLAIL